MPFFGAPWSRRGPGLPFLCRAALLPLALLLVLFMRLILFLLALGVLSSDPAPFLQSLDCPPLRRCVSAIVLSLLEGAVSLLLFPAVLVSAAFSVHLPSLFVLVLRSEFKAVGRGISSRETPSLWGTTSFTRGC